jgi:hypothetical protein
MGQVAVRLTVLVALAALILAACKDEAEPRTRLEAGEACPVTAPPQPGFAAPAPWGQEPPAPLVWFSDEDIWTTLSPDGERGTTNDRGRYELRQFWLSDNFVPRAEDPPKIELLIRRLDGLEVVRIPAPGSSGTRPVDEYWEFMIAGASLPTLGCWKIAASYKGTTLSYITLVQDAVAP